MYAAASAGAYWATSDGVAGRAPRNTTRLPSRAITTIVAMPATSQRVRPPRPVPDGEGWTGAGWGTTGSGAGEGAGVYWVVGLSGAPASPPTLGNTGGPTGSPPLCDVMCSSSHFVEFRVCGTNW